MARGQTSGLSFEEQEDCPLPIQRFKSRIGVWTFVCVGALATLLPLASAQAQSAPVPSSIPRPGGLEAVDTSPAGLAERVRRLEQMNQQLLQQYTSVSSQFQNVTRQNEELSRTVQDLSKRLEDPNQGQRAPA